MVRKGCAGYTTPPSAPFRTPPVSLPPDHAPLVREHRLYQADWLMRFYGFSAPELETDKAGNLDLSVDPKLSWALAHRDQFPVDINSAPKEMLLRIPGIGVKSVNAILRARRYRRLRMDDLARLRLPLAKISAFVSAAGHLGGAGLDSERLRQRVAPRPAQADLFG